jgi:hypothetical protein
MARSTYTGIFLVYFVKDAGVTLHKLFKLLLHVDCTMQPQ